jgi:hypothetical protein
MRRQNVRGWFKNVSKYLPKRGREKLPRLPPPATEIYLSVNNIYRLKTFMDFIARTTVFTERVRSKVKGSLVKSSDGTYLIPKLSFMPETSQRDMRHVAGYCERFINLNIYPACLLNHHRVKPGMEYKDRFIFFQNDDDPNVFYGPKVYVKQNESKVQTPTEETN